jgi:O-antigen/teichoic acid export membrane protein
MNVGKIFGTNGRTALIRKNIIVSFLLKGWSGLIFLLIVPLTLHCLGDYKNGIWLTISSMLIWMDNLDIGLGNGLRNKLATHLAHDDMEKARESVSSTFFMLILIIVPAALVLIALVNLTNLYSFLNIDRNLITDLNNVAMVSIIFVCSTLIFKFIGNFYIGLQLPAASNLLITCGHTIILIGTYILYKSGSHSLMLIALVNTGSPLIIYLLAYPYTFCKRYPKLSPSIKYFNMHAIKELFSIGMKFFVLQMSSAIIFMSSNILVSKMFSPASVTPYQIAYRYVSIVLLVFSIICAPNWTATTDAYERGDMEWIKKTKNTMNKILTSVFILMVFMVAISNFAYGIWVGKGVIVPLSITIGMAVYMYILIYSMSYCFFLNGIGILHIQLICTVGGAIAFIPLTYLATSLYKEIISILIILCIVNLPSLIFNKIQFEKIINGTAKGIWIRK